MAHEGAQPLLHALQQCIFLCIHRCMQIDIADYYQRLVSAYFDYMVIILRLAGTH